MPASRTGFVQAADRYGPCRSAPGRRPPRAPSIARDRLRPAPREARMTTIRSAAELAAATAIASRTEELFRQSGALKEGHFLLKSGKHSERYLEKFLVLQDRGPQASCAVSGQRATATRTERLWSTSWPARPRVAWFWPSRPPVSSECGASSPRKSRTRTERRGASSGAASRSPRVSECSS